MMEMLSHPSAHFSMPYRHISRDDRKTIASLISGGRHNHSEIAEQIGKSPSAVSREIAAGSGEDGRYVPGEADRRSAGKRSDANAGRRKITEGSEAEKAVLAGLKLFWSPEQIAGRHLLDSGAPLASHVTVYAYVAAHGKDLFRYLRHGKGRLRRRRHGTKQREKRREEGKKRRIDARPDVVAARSRVGDWEGDTVVGQEKTVHVLTHVDRKTGYLYATSSGAPRRRSAGRPRGGSGGARRRSSPPSRTTTAPSSPSTRRSSGTSGSRSTSPTRTTRGSAGPTRTRTAC